MCEVGKKSGRANVGMLKIIPSYVITTFKQLRMPLVRHQFLKLTTGSVLCLYLGCSITNSKVLMAPQLYVRVERENRSDSSLLVIISHSKQYNLSAFI